MIRTLARWVGRLVPLTVLLFWFAVLRPVSMGGGASYVIVTGGSMEPMLAAGDLVIAQRQPGYAVGDVVVYRIPEHLGYGNRQVVHRITGGDAAAGYRLQGDASAHADPWIVPADHVLGKVDTHLPFAGRVALVVRSPLVLASFAAGIAFVIVAFPARAQRREEQLAPAQTARAA